MEALNLTLLRRIDGPSLYALHLQGLEILTIGASTIGYT